MSMQLDENLAWSGRVFVRFFFLMIWEITLKFRTGAQILEG